MTFDWHDDNGNVKWCWLEIGKAALMLQGYSPAANMPDTGLNQSITIYFICEDALTIYNEVLNRGIKVAEPFVGHNMWVVELTDPDGHRLFLKVQLMFLKKQNIQIGKKLNRIPNVQVSDTTKQNRIIPIAIGTGIKIS
jgi:hypothetical protein